MKMIAIGLRQAEGRRAFHRAGFTRFHTLIPAVGSLHAQSRQHAVRHRARRERVRPSRLIEAVPGPKIIDREQELLKIARQRIGRLPGEQIDVLFVDEIGKDISGDGADPNVINRDISGLLEQSELNLKPSIHRVIFRDLTEDTAGQCLRRRIGRFRARQLADKIDPVTTYMNVITSKYPAGGRTPMVAANDRQALHFALASAQRVEAETAKIARIKNTKDVEYFWASEPLLPELLETGRVTVLTEMAAMAFDANGMFVE